MKKLILAVFLLFSVCSLTNAETLESPVINKDSTVQLWSPMEGDLGGSCNGVIVNETEDYTYVLTAKHCLPEDYKGTLVGPYRHTVNYVKHNTKDLALLRILGTFVNKKTVIIAENEPKLYTKVYRFTNRSGEESLSKGKITLFAWGKIHSNVGAIKGDSGSGIYNYRGELVGILFAGKEDIVVHVGVETIQKFLENNKEFWNK